MANLSLKKAVSATVELLTIQANKDHQAIEASMDSIEAALNNLDSVSAVTYGAIIENYDSDTIVAFTASNDTTDVSTYTTSTRLNLGEATALAIEIGAYQAKNDHNEIRSLLSAAGENAAITDTEILEMFNSDVQNTYKANHPEEYPVENGGE